MILIQPLLDPHGWGRHTTFTSTSANASTTQVEELYRLFYVWNNEEEDGEDHVDDYGDSDDDDTTRRRLPNRRRRRRTKNDVWDTGVGSHQEEGNGKSREAGWSLSPIENWYHALVAVNNDTPLPPMTSKTAWTTPKQIEEAIRRAFKTFNKQNPAATVAVDTSHLHKYSIRAIQLLREQQIMWNHSSTHVTDSIVRVTATSQCIEKAASDSVLNVTLPPVVTPQMVALSTKYRFAYRIRLENVSTDQTVQLVGRYWHIAEQQHDSDDSSSSAATPPPIEVNAPYTGAVGQLPVLQPGQVFEYMSGTDLATPCGQMKGHLYMARVPKSTISAKSGDEVDALKFASATTKDTMTEQESDELESRLFEAAVAPFPLEAL
jgi:uncharacterized protein affecting Mg2+/Co2+ transport